MKKSIHIVNNIGRKIITFSLLLSLGILASPLTHAFDAPPKDQGHTGPGSGNGDPNNPNGPNQGEGGDPIHVKGGNFTVYQEDLLLLGRGMPLLVKRSYNSHDNYYEGPFGFGWSFSYSVTATETVNGEGKAIVIVRDGDGVQHIFTHTAGNEYAPPKGRYNKLVKTGVNTYEITRKDAVKLLLSKSRLDAIIDPNGNQLSLSYAADGKVISIVNPSGRSVSIGYGVNNKISSVTDSSGRIVRYAYDANHNLVSVTNPAGEVLQYQYDSGHRLKATIDANGTVRLSNTYNADAQVTQQVSDGRTYRYDYQPTYTRVQDPSGRYIYHYFNNDGNTIRRSNQLGQSNHYEYNSDFNLSRQTDSRGSRTDFTYDAKGNIETIVDAGNKTTRFETHAVFGVLTKTTDSLGRETRYDYDSRGNLIKKTDALGNVTQFEYNSHGQVVRTTDEAGKHISLAYNSAGDLISITNARGEITRFEYDNLGRRTRLIDPLGNVSSFVYDAMDRLLNATNALGATVRYQYDKLGNLVKLTDPNANFVSYTYNSYGLNTAVSDSLGNTTTYAYDVNGNLVKVTDPLGNARIFAYDAANRLIKVTEADGSITAYDFDSEGNNTKITDPRGNVTALAYDALNRVVKTTYADNSFENKTYDAVGNVTVFRNRSGGNFNFAYDVLDRVIRETLPNGSVETATFNNLGFFSSVADTQGNISYTYDDADQLTTIADIFGKQFSYEYDAAGRRTKLTDSDGLETDYQYDNTNRLTHVTRQAKTTVFSYDDGGRLLNRTLPNGVKSVYTYDQRDLIVSLQHKKADDTVLSSYQYLYDVAGNQTRVTELDGSSVEYQYDAVYRLTREIHRAPDAAVTYDMRYEYDPNGNRIKATLNGSSVNYVYNNLNQLVSSDTATYSYDANGNMLSVTEGSNVTQYQYDDKNRLLKIILPDGSEVNTRYDAEGKRVEYTESGQTSRFHYDLATLYSEADTAGAVHRSYNRSLGIISQSAAGVEKYYLPDGNGNIRQLLNSDATVSDTYKYDAFGNVIDRTGATVNPYQYAGNWGYYSIGSLTHIGARYYAPPLGRFLTADPLHQGSNWYTYAFNDPVNLIDPDGQWVHIAIGAGIGALINTGVYLYSTPRSQWSLGGGLRAAATGAVVGGVGAATFGASMPATLGGALARGAVSGLAGQLASDLTNSAFDQKLQFSSPWTYAGSAALGGALGGLGYGASKALQSWRGAPKGTCCFVAGTPVLTKDGYKNIESIELGDQVLAKNTDSGEQGWKPVTQLFKKYRLIYELRVLEESGQEYVIETTDDHPFYISGKGWVNTVDLLSSDLIETEGYGWVTVVSILQTSRNDITYNLEVADFHTYYATKLNLLVHNCGGSTPKSGVPGDDFVPNPNVTDPYARPSAAGPNAAQKASVQGKPCVDCGAVTPNQVADHIDPLVVQHYREGAVNVQQQSQVSAVQPHCPACSASQGGQLGAFGRRMREFFGF